MSRQAIDPEMRARALELARTEGVAAAVEHTGVSAGTIRVWLSRSKAKAAKPADKAAQVAPTAESVTGLTDYEGKTLGAAKRAVESALKRLEELLPNAKGVQSVAISAGILMDKVERLNEVIAEAQEREVQMTERDAQIIMGVITAALDACGVPTTEARRKLIAALLRQGVSRQPIVASPAQIEEAVGEYRAALRARIKAELEHEQRVRERMARPALPAPAPEPTTDEELRVCQEEAEVDEADADVEVVSGEVVDEGPTTHRLHGLGGGWIQTAPGTYTAPGDRMPRWRA
jgi:hypothetical protein